MLIINIIIISMSENWIPLDSCDLQIDGDNEDMQSISQYPKIPICKSQFLSKKNLYCIVVHVNWYQHHRSAVCWCAFLPLIKPLQQLQQSASTKSYRLTVLFSKNGNNCFIPIEFKSTGLKTNILSNNFQSLRISLPNIFQLWNALQDWKSINSVKAIYQVSQWVDQSFAGKSDQLAEWSSIFCTIGYWDTSMNCSSNVCEMFIEVHAVSI